MPMFGISLQLISQEKLHGYSEKYVKVEQWRLVVVLLLNFEMNLLAQALNQPVAILKDSAKQQSDYLLL